MGLRRAFAVGRSRFSKILATIAATLGLLICAMFVFVFFVAAKWIPQSTGAPHVGQKAPEFRLADINNKQVTLSDLLSTPLEGKQPKGVLLVFYRGYWWPSCNSELRSIEKNLSLLNAEGIRPVAISADTPEESRNLTQQAGYSFTFLSDRQAQTIKLYDLVHAGAGENGRDIARPAEFLIDSTGMVRWVNLTENYMVRARLEQILAAAKKL